ncbi:hypothetical protein RvY_13127 [Ramazzottius varieornatus]|uniref:Ubiquitin carboxyl-terminal hydrolase n=1 Tax=Ramazzottius varieornatus TaxID=947166 RepID=A0A1D1VQX0_RAMVA|nr:hypothetical protein RvY_13127 [Ramazzottius varieornatus]
MEKPHDSLTEVSWIVEVKGPLPDVVPTEKPREDVVAAVEPTAPVQPTAPPPKKSWADLMKPVASSSPTPKNDVNLSLPQPPSSTKTNIRTGRSSSITPQPFVVTSEAERQHTEEEKIQRLGEIMFSKNLLGAEKKFDHRTLFLTPRGMMNRGNACYMNAVLQTLIFCPPFFHLLESLDVPSYDDDDQVAQLPPITDAFVRLAKCFHRIPKTGARNAHLRTEDPAVDPSFVYDTLEEHGTASHKEMLSRGSQEDAQESLNHILLLIHEEMAKAEATIRDDHDGRTNGVDAQWNDEWTNINKKQKKSIMRSCVDFKDTPISGVFGGKLRSIRKHHGAKEFENVEPFFMLDLPIQDPRVKSVFQAIDRFMGTETLHGYVDRGQEVRAQRHYKFEELPAVLILHLKYFEYSPTGGLAKLQKNIEFEATLRLPERWFAERHFNPAKSVYRLSAVVYHYGEGTEGGHYTACMYHPASPSSWIEANDSVVSVVGFDYVRAPQFNRVPYLLFYRLQTNNYTES